MGQINKDRDGRMVMRYLSESQYELAFNAKRGYCRACGDYQENVATDVEYADCPSCGCPTLFSANKLGERNYVLKPNSSLVHIITRHRTTRGH